MDIYLREDLETVIDLVLLATSLLVLFLGCRGMLKSGVRQKRAFIYITILGLVTGVLELLDFLELMPRSILAKTVIGTTEILVLTLLIFAFYQYHLVEKKKI